jgi:hypothetical protein
MEKLEQTYRKDITVNVSQSDLTVNQTSRSQAYRSRIDENESAQYSLRLTLNTLKTQIQQQ